MGFSGFSIPATPTRLRAFGESDWLTGDVEVVGGVALSPRHRTVGAAGVVLDTVGANPAEAASLFIPGDLTAREVARFTRLGDNPAELGFLELYALTAPSGVDASNHRALRVSGSVSGSADLGLSIAGEPHYSYNGRVPVALHTFDDTELSPDSQPGSGIPSGHAWAHGFRPTSDSTVQGLAFAKRAANTSDTYPEGNVRPALLSADASEYLAVGSWVPWTDIEPANVNASSGPSAYNYLDFIASVDLSQGVDYIAGFEVDGTWSEVGTSAVYAASPSGTGSRTLGVSGVGATQGYGTVAGGSLLGAASEIAYGGWLSPPIFRLYGAPTGVQLYGDEIVVEVVDVGTPPGTPGADVNVRFGFYYAGDGE